MEESEYSEAEVRRAATLGARSVSRHAQVVADAVQQAVGRWEDAILAGKVVRDWGRWVRRVAANAAKKLGTARSGLGGGVGGAFDVASLETTGFDDESLGLDLGLDAVTRRKLLSEIRKMRFLLVGRQYEVLALLCTEGMSLHRAAKELGMSRYNLKRAFQSGLRRLKTARVSR